MSFLLADTVNSRVLSAHPNVAGAKISALFHVNNGDQVEWRNAGDKPLQVAACYGYVNGEKRFVVQSG